MEYIGDIIVGTASVITMTIAVYIAWQQHRTDVKQYRLAALERRYCVYDSIVRLCAAIVANGQPCKDDMDRFESHISQATFLFDGNVEEYLSRMRNKGHELLNINETNDEQSKDNERDASIRKQELFKWFKEQYGLGDGSNGAKEFFLPYLRIEK